MRLPRGQGGAKSMWQAQGWQQTGPCHTPSDRQMTVRQIPPASRPAARRRPGKSPPLLTALLLLVGCAPLPDAASPLHFDFARGWQTRIAGAPRLLDDRQWWRGLQDPTLDALVARALQGNPDLMAARARAEAARSAARSVPGAITLPGGGSALASGGSGRSADTTIAADLGFDVLFDPGRGRAAERLGARAGAAEAEAQQAAARLVLIGQMAEAYLVLRHDQQRLALARAEAGRQRQTLELARTLAAQGEGTQIETLRSEARLASLQATLPGLEAAVATGLIQISVLAGDAPGALPSNLVAALQGHGGQPRARLAPDPGLPADLLRNRPDLRLAEARYDGARAALGKARAALYPRLSLSGTIELSQSTLGSARSHSSLSSFGPSLRLPALPTAPAQANVDAATRQITAAHADWTGAVLSALAEVETALVNYRAAVRSESAADKAVRLHSETRALMRQMATQGEATLSDLIAVQDALSEAELAQAFARLSRAQAFVRLNLRLGSGS